MGVPGFFRWLLRNADNRKIIKKNINTPDILYLDANCLFHPECFKTIENNPQMTNNKELEKIMIQNIVNYIVYLIEYVEAPKICIMVDGVAPMAKINQQRKRRYKSVHEKNERNKIKKKYGKNVSSWSNIVISPGTEFMESLHKNILDFVDEYEKLYSRSVSSIEYSSYHEPGEGEHKILQHIKMSNYKNICIYGLDADLIFLSLSLINKNINLLREEVNFKGIIERNDDNKNKLCYVSINNLKTAIVKIIDKDCQNKNNLIGDFIFICYFLGNDFIPHLPSINISSEGLEILLSIYDSTKKNNDGYLTNIGEDEIGVNSIFFEDFIKRLSIHEEESYNASTHFRKKKENRDKKKRFMDNLKKNSDKKYESEIYDFENLDIDIDNVYEKSEFVLWDAGNNEWKNTYRSIYFSVDEFEVDTMNTICKKYFEGIIWTLNYYFNGCKSWNWQYPYSHGPFVKDLYNYIVNENFNINSVEFQLSEPLKPCVQLLSIIPPQYFDILPKKYQKLKSNINICHYFPEKISIDTIGQDLYWKCIPIVPIIDSQILLKETENIELSRNEKGRNMAWEFLKFSGQF